MVVAIIAVLLAILAPAVGRGFAAARSFRCQTSLRSVAFDFTVFADEALHPRRGNDENRTPGRFGLDTFIESQYGIDEFWSAGTAATVVREAGKGGDDPMRCAEVRGTITLNRALPCTLGAITPASNISYGFNLRLSRPESKEGNRIRSVLLSEKILLAGRVPLVFDVDAPAAAKSGTGTPPTFGAPPLGVVGPYATGKFWYPGLRHAGAMNVGFVDGSVDSSSEALKEAGWKWDYRPH